jgi:aminoglycoside 6'-N-acetyltransferase
VDDVDPAAEQCSLSFVALTRGDLPLVHDWLTTEHVARWWAPTAAACAQVEHDLMGSIDGTDPTEVFLVHLDDVPIGLIQRYRIADDPDWARALSVAADVTAAAGIDYLIGVPSLVARGLGTAMIAAFALDTFDRYPELSQIVVDPQVANRASWRALERAGFERVWTGRIDDDDPSNVGDAHVYRLTRAQVVGRS